MSKASVLYITYDGITDHIGQSQVAPYLLGLAAKGHKITLLSAEKPGKEQLIKKYQALFSTSGIEWYHISYTYRPPVFSTVWDVRRLIQKARILIRKNHIQAIHCRSYVASLVGLHFKKKLGIRFIFDMRDFWPDARKEVKSFDVDNNALHRQVYRFFKRKEREFLESADHIVSLTAAGKKIMQDWADKGEIKITAPISVIPCCADYVFFDPALIDTIKLEELRSNLRIPPGAFVLNYLGSLGPAYLTNELLDLFKILLKHRPDAVFLVVANNDHHLIKDAAAQKGISTEKLIVTQGKKEDIPYLITLSDLSAFFIMPSFAKQACSPTKLAELFAMNVPVISNTKVGDLDTILNLDRNSSTVVQSFDEAELERAIIAVLERLPAGKKQIRENSLKYSVNEGIALYHQIYSSL